MIDTGEMIEIAQSMTNFDHSIEEGMEEALKAKPGKVFGRYSGWDFHAQVYFLDEQFHAEVRVHRQVMEIVSADTLEEIMTKVCSGYGAD